MTKGVAAAQADVPRLRALLDAIEAAAHSSGLEAALIAAIVSRETAGDPRQFLGDHGHGHGPMQLDSRWYPTQCAAYRAGVMTDAQIMAFCAALLFRAIKATGGLHAGIAAYNAGVGGVHKATAAGLDPDTATTGADYAKDVQERLEALRELGF